MCLRELANEFCLNFTTLDNNRSSSGAREIEMVRPRCKQTGEWTLSWINWYYIEQSLKFKRPIGKSVGRCELANC